MIGEAKIHRQELEERVLYLQLTLAALQAQLDSEAANPTDRDDAEPVLPKAEQTTGWPEIPLPIAAG
jgi:hypothetical protein